MLERGKFPEDITPEVGLQLQIQQPNGQPMPVVVKASQRIPMSPLMPITRWPGRHSTLTLSLLKSNKSHAYIKKKRDCPGQSRFFFYVIQIPYLSVSAVIPGSSLPSRYSRLAPPPVETWVTLSSSPRFFNSCGRVTTANDGNSPFCGSFRQRPGLQRRSRC